MSGRVICAAFACFAAGLRAQPSADWTVARSAHFEVYSQAGEKSAVAGLAWFEDLRSFVSRQTGLLPDTAEPVRVIAFRSPNDYAPYQLESLADAYYVGAGSHNYLVLPSLDPENYGTAAHEYGHFLFRLAGLDLPSWLREGMAEVFSSVHMTPAGSRIGGDLAPRAQLLRRKAWLPLSRILSWPEAPLQADRDAVELFYSQSWALTEMLAFAPEYQSGFRRLVAMVGSGTPGEQALARVYGKSLDGMVGDLRSRAGHRVAVPLSGGTAVKSQASTASVSWFDMRVMLGGVMLLVRNFDRAGAVYRELSRESPDRADVTAGLGAVAFAKGDRTEAQYLWRRAVQQGLADAEVCYQYAMLLDGVEGEQDELRSILELAIRLRPVFADARFRLALLEENAGRHEAAVKQLDAIGTPVLARAYQYWCTMSQALAGLGRNEDAAGAAQHAVEAASNSPDRVHALQLVRIARTHPEVQFTRDDSGKLILTTTRVPNEVSAWNAFVEPGDDLRRVEGTMLEIECTDSGLRLVIDTGSGRLPIAIPDPSHVTMRNAPAEFVCGVQEPSRVIVEYAAAKAKGPVEGVARGIEFVTQKQK